MMKKVSSEECFNRAMLVEAWLNKKYAVGEELTIAEFKEECGEFISEAPLLITRLWTGMSDCRWVSTTSLVKGKVTRVYRRVI